MAPNRSFAKVTGSTLNAALGFNGLKFRQKHFDMVCRSIKPPGLSETVKQRMHHGRDNEINVIATLASKFLQDFYRDLGYVEEVATWNLIKMNCLWWSVQTVALETYLNKKRSLFRP